MGEKYYREGCVICGKALKYFEDAHMLSCYLCGEMHLGAAECEDSHFICDKCHSDEGTVLITLFAHETKSNNPIEVATSMMNDISINMHGPEHHYMVVAALLAAYNNSGGSIELDTSLRKALQRAKEVPGGICGFWGSCGAGIATGIFMSIITNANPLSENEWALSNMMSAKSLEIISKNGGPRCCKRNTYLSIAQAVEFVEENFNISMGLPDEIFCKFSDANAQCRKEKCLYYTLIPRKSI